eukprot:5740264-Pleurochrysis_carterae.AAC.1
MSLHCSLILPTLLLLLLLLCLWSSSLLRLLFFAPAVGTLNVRLPCACSSLAALRSIVGTRAQLTHQWAHSCDIWGNSLNEYWQGRAVAAAAGVPFVAHGVACGMLAELPNKLQPADESTSSFACAPICSGCSHLPHSSHLCSGGWRLMLDVVQNDMHAAMLRWQARRKSGIPCERSALVATWPESVPTEAGAANRVEARTDTGRSVGDRTADGGGPHAGQSAQESWSCAEAYDVAIHFRCGDIRRRCGYDAYGLLTHEYYTRAMQALGLAGALARLKCLLSLSLRAPPFCAICRFELCIFMGGFVCLEWHEGSGPDCDERQGALAAAATPTAPQIAGKSPPPTTSSTTWHD